MQCFSAITLIEFYCVVKTRDVVSVSRFGFTSTKEKLQIESKYQCESSTNLSKVFLTFDMHFAKFEYLSIKWLTW